MVIHVWKVPGDSHFGETEQCGRRRIPLGLFSSTRFLGVDGLALNLGTGRATKISDLARLVREIVDGPEPVSTRHYRPGDVRHCVADARNAARLLEWKPDVQLEVGLVKMAEWLRRQRPPKEILGRPFVELDRMGLL